MMLYVFIICDIMFVNKFVIVLVVGCIVMCYFCVYSNVLLVFVRKCFVILNIVIRFVLGEIVR